MCVCVWVILVFIHRIAFVFHRKVVRNWSLNQRTLHYDQCKWSICSNRFSLLSCTMRWIIQLHRNNMTNRIGALIYYCYCCCSLESTEINAKILLARVDDIVSSTSESVDVTSAFAWIYKWDLESASVCVCVAMCSKYSRSSCIVHAPVLPTAFIVLWTWELTSIITLEC